MNEIMQIILYSIGIILSFLCLYFIDFNKFMRIGKKEYAILVYVLLSIAIGFLIGYFFVTMGTLFSNAFV